MFGGSVFYAERFGDSFDGKPLIVAHHERHALHGAEFLQRRGKQRGYFGTAGHAVRPGFGRSNALENFFVVDCRRAPAPGAMMIESAIRTDAVKPGGERSPPIEPPDVFPRPQERFLGEIFGIVLVSAHTICNFVDSPGMVLHQETKGIVISLLRQFQTGVNAMIHLACQTPAQARGPHSEEPKTRPQADCGLKASVVRAYSIEV